jgi:dolichol-phosphate mannosyltransferase
MPPRESGSAGDLPVPSSASIRSLSVIVPTYKEVKNIPLLVDRLDKVRQALGIEFELLFMDDNSQDGSAEVVQGLALPWVQLITRTTDRGLSPAVLDGLRRAKGEVMVVMDADLSHPPEALPQMLAELGAGADFVVGSRFVAGGTTDDDWGVFRWLNSKVATLLAAPLTSVKDPMSGYFMLRRSTFEGGTDFNPIGYKIGLELLVKCRCKRAVEVPIHFTDRQLGESKLSMAEQLRYLQHIRRLYIARFAVFSQVIQFLVVGASGLAVNLLCLTLVLALSVPTRAAVLVAIAVSMVWNFVLNRRFSFSYARALSPWRQFVTFVSASSLGAGVNYIVTIAVLPVVHVPQIAATVGVLSATVLNFLASRYWVFKVTHITRKEP